MQWGMINGQNYYYHYHYHYHHHHYYYYYYYYYRETNNSGYHECSFAVSEKFFVKKKRRDRCPTLKVTDEGRGLLGQLQRQLVAVLSSLTDKVEVQVLCPLPSLSAALHCNVFMFSHLPHIHIRGKSFRLN